MLKNSRIKKDIELLKQNGFKKIKNKRSYNYGRDWEYAAMVYTCKKENEKYEQVIMPKDIEFDNVFENKIKTNLDGYDILHKKQDVNENGILFNLVTRRKNKTIIVYASYNVANDVVNLNQTTLSGDSYV